MGSAIIERPTFLSTLQDGGRWGYQRYGMPVSGATDQYAYRLANWLVSNPHNCAVLEDTLGGSSVVFTEDAAIAVCGADIQPCIDEKNVPLYQTLKIRAGDRLSFHSLKSGCRVYTAVSGGFDVPMVMGSRSTSLYAGMGGWKGRPLRKGDIIPRGQSVGVFKEKQIPNALIPDYSDNEPLDVIPGPEAKRLTREALSAFLRSEYEVSMDSNRMGIRLKGPELACRGNNHDIQSSATAFGMVQLPGNGQPIVLLADRPTMGGYPRIAYIATYEHHRLAQLRPGDKIRFREVGLLKAQKLLKNHLNKLSELERL